MRSLEIIPILGMPEVAPGDNLARHIHAAAERGNTLLANGDILVVTQKIISKAEGQIVSLAGIIPSEQARAWAATYQRDPRVIELVLRESARIVRMERGVIIAETRHGFICANAGVDASNTAAGTATLLPADPNQSARKLQAELEQILAVHLAVIVSDTFGRPWREGLVNVALGVAGMAALADYRGRTDPAGQKLSATVIAQADEIASAAELVMGKLDRVPVAIIRGLSPTREPGSGADLLRKPETDLFR